MALRSNIGMNIVFLDEDTVVLKGDVDLSGLRGLGEYAAYELAPGDDPLPFCGDAEVIIVNKVRLTRERMEKLPNLKLICEAATGYDNIDIGAARELGIRVSNVAGYAKTAVVQHVFAMILSFTTKIFEYNRDVRAGEWQKSKTFDLLKYHTFELSGLILGIIGFGSIGRGIAGVGEAFGMEVMVHDVVDIESTGYTNFGLDEVLTRADVVSIMCPLTDQTRNLINAKALKRMKPSAILINTARGGIVNEQDLADALNQGVIAGAGVDTLSKEPPKDGNPLLGEVKNLLLTPHSAWSTRNARQRLMDIVKEKIERYRVGDFEGFIV
jgi:glycerate dehydrogenase